jgi:hypothetical protein
MERANVPKASPRETKPTPAWRAISSAMTASPFANSEVAWSQ